MKAITVFTDVSVQDASSSVMRREFTISFLEKTTIQPIFGTRILVFFGKSTIVGRITVTDMPLGMCPA